MFSNLRFGLVRFGLVGLAAINGWWGAWARFWPRNFFDTFPGFGHRWTAAYPPYNEHLITDLGATFLTLASCWPSPRRCPTGGCDGWCWPVCWCSTGCT